MGMLDFIGSLGTALADTVVGAEASGAVVKSTS